RDRRLRSSRTRPNEGRVFLRPYARSLEQSSHFLVDSHAARLRGSNKNGARRVCHSERGEESLAPSQIDEGSFGRPQDDNRAFLLEARSLARTSRWRGAERSFG